MTSSSPPISLTSLKIELQSFYAALALAIDECYEAGAGARMLNSDPHASGSFYDRVDVERSRLGALLPAWYRYAYEGVLSAGHARSEFEEVDGAFGRLLDLVDLFGNDQAYLRDAQEHSGVGDAPRGHLKDLTTRVLARADLDSGRCLTIAQVAALAEMNERSVRNATSADGDARLVLQPDGHVANAEAVRWLGGRRGFIPTQRRQLQNDVIPEDLLDTEIPAFVRSRLFSIYGESGTSQANGVPWTYSAAKAAELPVVRIESAMSLPIDIRPQECAALARAMQVDPSWFTLQVMSALFPDQVDLLLNPAHWQLASTVNRVQEALGAVTVSLTPAMLKNGYIDIPMSARAMFPPDAIGTRQTGDEGTQLEFVFGAHRVLTDIRQKSQQTLSPRKRFYAWLNTELGAKPGDRIRIERTSNRQFTMTHLNGQG